MTLLPLCTWPRTVIVRSADPFAKSTRSGDKRSSIDLPASTLPAPRPGKPRHPPATAQRPTSKSGLMQRIRRDRLRPHDRRMTEVKSGRWGGT
ncbi:hypothetical protein PHSY_003027 [Pseudozyma hubeiensis SY62]|uniref:Uncharacterized protein n=1 Tax=Pseudozyma hubeiensis (strain SY62) TaxID=1305764 RepID=R9P2B3_PSEHS|nr:hypothetical protein PHSY_003027 [Pseudozyma hubeiensis SY62]GAC95451.1 hypothetical protein PHSY_003027 [Pseudozyma hubeiensis SY62]